MKIEIPRDLEKEAYPLAWLLGKWHGSALTGGNWGLEAKEAQISTSFVAIGNAVEYETVVESVEQVILKETGRWKVASTRPELLTDPQLFPLEIATRSYYLGAQTQTLSSNCVGIIGKGRVEIVAKNISLHTPTAKIGGKTFNELASTKQMFGYVNARLLWAYDLTFAGTETASILAGSMIKDA
jgi:hypothetical protein